MNKRFGKHWLTACYLTGI